MRLIGIGLAAALALGALAPSAVLSADKAATIDKKALEQGMKEAPAAVAAAGVKCTITGARFVGKGKDPKTKVEQTYYEVACSDNMGFIVGGPADQIRATGCVDMKTPGPDGKPNPLQCILPANQPAEAGLAAYVSKNNCTVEKARYIGANTTNAYYEVACQGGAGYLVRTLAKPDPTGEVISTPCYAIEPGGNLACTLTDGKAGLGVVDTLAAASNKGCTVKDKRYVLSTKGGADIFEVACEDGKGYMLEKTAAGALGRVFECAQAENYVQGGCTLTDARAAQTEQAGLYGKLAKKAGFDCDVEKYAALTGARGEDVVELKCKNRPDGAIAIFTDTSNTVYDCAHSELVGYRCVFTKPDAAFAKLTADLNTLGKKECVVSGARTMGVTTSGKGYIEVACADGGLGWVIEYNTKPTLTPATTLMCRESKGLGGGCKLPTNLK